VFSLTEKGPHSIHRSAQVHGYMELVAGRRLGARMANYDTSGELGEVGLIAFT